MEILSIIKEIVIIGAAITASIVAVKGLSTWQRQLKGQSEYDLSRRILVSLFKYRDAINGVRNPAMWADEMPSPPEEKSKTMHPDQISFYGTSNAYQARWDKVQEERTSLYADLLEAEAIWGTELNDFFKVVFDLQHELFTQVRHYLISINPDQPETRKNAIEKIDKDNRDIIYDDLDEKPDEYKSDLIDAIKVIESYLKPKLSQERGQVYV